MNVKPIKGFDHLRHGGAIRRSIFPTVLDYVPDANVDLWWSGQQCMTVIDNPPNFLMASAFPSALARCLASEHLEIIGIGISQEAVTKRSFLPDM
jgi:hypothetical protein